LEDEEQDLETFEPDIELEDEEQDLEILELDLELEDEEQDLETVEPDFGFEEDSEDEQIIFEQKEHEDKLNEEIYNDNDLNTISVLITENIENPLENTYETKKKNREKEEIEEILELIDPDGEPMHAVESKEVLSIRAYLEEEGIDSEYEEEQQNHLENDPFLKNEKKNEVETQLQDNIKTEEEIEKINPEEKEKSQFHKSSERLKQEIIDKWSQDRKKTKEKKIEALSQNNSLKETRKPTSIEKKQELQDLFRKKTGKRPIYAGRETKGFIEWKKKIKCQENKNKEKKLKIVKKKDKTIEISEFKEEFEEEWAEYLKKSIYETENEEIPQDTKEELIDFLFNYYNSRELYKKLKRKEITEEIFRKEINEIERNHSQEISPMIYLFRNFNLFRNYYNELIQKAGKNVTHFYTSKKIRDFLSYISKKLEESKKNENYQKEMDEFKDSSVNSIEIKENWAIFLNNLIFDSPNIDISKEIKDELQKVIKKYCEIRIIIFNKKILKKDKENLILERTEKYNPNYFQLFEILKTFVRTYINYSKRWMEKSLIIEGRKIIKQLSQKLNEIKKENNKKIPIEFLKYLYEEFESYEIVSEFLFRSGSIKTLHPNTISKKIRSSFKSEEDYKNWLEKIKIRKFKLFAKINRGEFRGDKYLGVKAPHLFYCKKHDLEFYISRDCLNRGQWCPKCGHAKAGKNQRIKLKDLVDIIESKGGICISKDYGKDQYDPIKIKCKMGHIFTILPKTLKRGAWCPTCNSGINERICRKILEYLFKLEFPKLYPKWLKNNEGQQMHLDGINKVLKLAFEYQGIQHYQYHSFFHRNKEAFNRQKKNDLIKKKLCKSHGIQLIEIPYYIKRDALFNYILNRCRNKGFSISKKIKTKGWQDFDIYSYEKYQKYKKLASKYGFKLISKTYKGYYEELQIKCKKCGYVLSKKPKSLQNKTQICPSCNFKSKIENLIYIINKVNAQVLKFRNRKYKNRKRLYFEIKCNVCDYVWGIRSDNINEKTHCPKCYGREKRTIERVNKYAQQYNSKCFAKEKIHKYYYFHFECCICGHNWKATFDSVKNRDYFCPKCLNKK
ncbi:MAG: hypothetical protein ACFFDH_11225, partial [Promethearchaeota archaeon]